MPDTIDKEASQDDPTSGIARALSRTERDYRRLRRGLVALLALAVVVILVILLWAAREQNLQHARHTHEQIETQLEQIRRRLIGQVLDYATWDLSHLAIHADDGPDLEWLELEMGSNLHDNLGIDLALLVSTDQEVLYEVHRGEPRRPPATDHGSLLAQSRLAQAPMTSGFALWQERPVLFATAPVLPESSHHVQAPSPHRLLFAFEVDNGLIGILREATNLPDLHLTAAPERPGRLPLRTRTGAPLAWLEWTPSAPGSVMLRRSMPWLLITLLGLGGFSTLLFQRLRHQARASLATVEELRQTQSRLAAQQRAWHDLRGMHLRDASEEEFIAALLECSSQLLDIPRISLWLLEGDDGRLICQASLVPETVGEELFGEDLEAYLVELHRTPALVADDAPADPRLTGLHDYLCRNEIASMLDIGLFVAGELRGVLCCESSRPRRWHTDEINALTSFSGLLCQFAESLRRREVERTLHRQLHYDQVTALPTLHGLEEYIESLRRQGPFLVGILHVKGLNQINDSLGTAFGDAALHEVGELLRRRLATPALQGVPARLPANRLCLLLPGDDRAGLHARLETLLDELDAHPWLNENAPASLHFSLGLAGYPQDSRNIDRLLQRAELALERARGEARHRLAFYDDALGQWQRHQSRLERELRDAISRREFRLYLQPQFADGGRLHGAEALLRWMHPERGLLGPGDFIAEAEHCRLIQPIGDWVLGETLALLAGPLRDTDLMLAVNVSVQQLRDPDFPARVESLLQSHALPAHRLVLEVVESLLVTPGVMPRLASLHALGLSIALDDFGTGYSSLRYLQELEVDEIKLDKVFLDPLKLRQDAPLARSIIALARALDLRLVAEGVETADQADFLRRQGVTLMQGYYLARPEPTGVFLRRLDA
ncbi:EAL domain-containing protein [Halomonas sp. M4R5S39]|uniref:bifunctional diguanylate cyclase/phosphodiesterase n=1 Tax=Halomonas kalidii TaxID=3043293 RepID=UPI0024A8A0F5|nr:EAL domain-containing protein [Halomonas kalidii]MDI5985551.1 EAL domain-containing protein [Halomonas kalidii]